MKLELIITLHYLKGVGAKYIRTYQAKYLELDHETQSFGTSFHRIGTKNGELYSNALDQHSKLYHLVLFKSTTHARFHPKRKGKKEN